MRLATLRKTGPDGDRVHLSVDGTPLAMLNNGTVYYLRPDRLGTVQRITDANRQIVWSAQYEPFGKAAVAGGIEYNPRLPGQYFDAETGLHYNYFRDYDSELGRYRESDPIGLLGGVNTYGYVGNNPVGLVDPSGLEGTGPWTGYGSDILVPGNLHSAVEGAVAGSTVGSGITTIARLSRMVKVFDAALPNCPTPKLTPADFPTVALKLSQKQLRHIANRNEYRGGGYLNSIQDAQKILDEYLAGNTEILGKNSQGFPVIRTESVTGTNVNTGVGITDQPTNVFMIKGTSNPSVVPMNPNWTP